MVDAATVEAQPMPLPSDGGEGRDSEPETPPKEDIPPVLRAIRQERRQHDLKRSGGALFPANRAAPNAREAPAGEIEIDPSSATSTTVGPQTVPSPDALFVPLGARRSQ